MAKPVPEELLAILEDLLIEDLKLFQWRLGLEVLEGFSPIPKSRLEEASRHDTVDHMVEAYGEDGAVKVSEEILRKMNQNQLAEELADYRKSEDCSSSVTPSRPALGLKPSACQQKLKSNLNKRSQFVCQGCFGKGKPSSLKKIFMELHIRESRVAENEHEIGSVDMASTASAAQDDTISYEDVFQHSPEKEKPNRVVLSSGIAGIGKTVATQKFCLDWTEGENNQDFQFVFPLPFRELNPFMEEKMSLTELIHHFFPEMKDSGISDYSAYKVLFILDGLDECRFPLEFSQSVLWRDSTTPTSVAVLLVNLIRGDLLPSASIWVTSRPAAAHRIPREHVDLMTEVRGFNDEQKVEYFKRIIGDEDVADSITEHIQSSRSLLAMCHIPLFCLIAAFVLEKLLGDAQSEEMPDTLTQMYIYYLAYQMKQTTVRGVARRERSSQWNKESIMSLGKLAYKQLQTGNLIFYEKDLTDCDVDISEVSAVCTQIFREDIGLHKGKVYCFVHLTMQEFLAALYAYISFCNDGVNVVSQTVRSKIAGFFNRSLYGFLKIAVDTMLESKNGNMDLFLRFLLGLSLESNRELLEGILTDTASQSQGCEEITKYIKDKIKMNSSPFKCMNLFHCLHELKDATLLKELLDMADRDIKDMSEDMSPEHWSMFTYIMLTTDEDLDDFSFSGSETALLRVLPLVKAAKTASLDTCELTWISCKGLAPILSSVSSNLMELDMSNNHLGNTGMKALCEGLKNPSCHLEILRLRDCEVKPNGFWFLAAALKSNPSHLRELDLSENSPGDVGVQLLAAALGRPCCKLEELSLSMCVKKRSGLAAVALNISAAMCEDASDFFSTITEAILDGENPLDGMWEETEFPDLTGKSCEALAAAVVSNPSHLRILDLRGNELSDTQEYELLQALEDDPDCRLDTLSC